MTDLNDTKAITDELREAARDAAYERHVVEWDKALAEQMLTRAADTIDALVKERDELSAVIDTAKDDLDGAWVSAAGTPLGEFLLEVHRALSTARERACQVREGEA